MGSTSSGRCWVERTVLLHDEKPTRISNRCLDAAYGNSCMWDEVSTVTCSVRDHHMYCAPPDMVGMPWVLFVLKRPSEFEYWSTSSVFACQHRAAARTTSKGGFGTSRSIVIVIRLRQDPTELASSPHSFAPHCSNNHGLEFVPNDSQPCFRNMCPLTHSSRATSNMPRVRVIGTGLDVELFFVLVKCLLDPHLLQCFFTCAYPLNCSFLLFRAPGTRLHHDYKRYLAPTQSP